MIFIWANFLKYTTIHLFELIIGCLDFFWPKKYMLVPISMYLFSTVAIASKSKVLFTLRIFQQTHGN